MNRRNAWRFGPPLALMLVIFLQSSRPAPVQPPVPLDLVAIVAHLLMFGALAGLWFRSLSSLPLRWRWIVAVGIAVVYGISDEYHQSFVEGRSATVFDVVVDAVGAVVVASVVAHVSSSGRRRDATRRGRAES